MKIVKRTESVGLAIGWSAICLGAGFVLARMMAGERYSTTHHSKFSPETPVKAARGTGKETPAEQWLLS